MLTLRRKLEHREAPDGLQMLNGRLRPTADVAECFAECVLGGVAQQCSRELIRGWAVRSCACYRLVGVRCISVKVTGQFTGKTALGAAVED